MSAVAADRPAERTVVLFGNDAPQMTVPVHDEDGVRVGQRKVPARHLRQSETRVVMWPGFDHPDIVRLALSTDNDRRLSMIGRTLADEHREYAIGVHELEEVVAEHAAGVKPAWVASSDRQFAEAIAAHFGCPVLDAPPSMLLTNVGRDAHHAQLYGTSAPPATFNYMALSANATAPAATNTTLAGEIVTAGLARALATYAHTAGTNTSTLTKTFTAVAADVSGGSVTVAKFAIFNAAAAGTEGYETLLNSTALISVAGDNVTVTETLTAG